MSRPITVTDPTELAEDADPPFAAINRDMRRREREFPFRDAA